MFVVHVDQPEGLDCRFFIDRGHQGHAVAHEPHLVLADHRLIGRNCAEPVPSGYVVGGHHRDDPRQLACPGEVDLFDEGMGVGASEDRAVQYLCILHVAQVFQLPRHLGEAVEPRF